MAKKERMGSGLDMLFEDNFHVEQSSEESGVRSLRISLIEPDKNQPRKSFNNEDLDDLAFSIEQHGVLQPIIVRPMENGSYKIIAGERRWRAARLAGLNEIPVIIKDLDDFQTAQISLIENVQREDLNPIEQAHAYRRLMDDYNMTQDQLAHCLGKSRSSIANVVRILNLDESIQDMISKGKITMGHAKVLLGITDKDLLDSLADKAAKGMSVRDLEQSVTDYFTLKSIDNPTDNDNKPYLPKVKNYSDPFKKYSKEVELSFKQLYNAGAKVRKEKDGTFSLKLVFKSEMELQEMISMLSKKE